MSTHGKDAIRLCEHIIRSAFGDVVCRIASTLLNRGRLSVPTICRLSGVSKRPVLASLLILLQQNLVQWDGNEDSEQEAYEFDVMECLMRLRWGRILAMTEQRLGTTALGIVKSVLDHGKLRGSDILSICGTGDSRHQRAVTAAVIDLIRGGFLQPTQPELQILASEAIQISFDVKRREKFLQTSAPLSAQATANLQAQAEYEVSKDRAALRQFTVALISAPPPKKSSKGVTLGAPNYTLRNEIYLRVNYDRYGVLMRDEMIVKATTERWNIPAGILMRTILDLSLFRDEDSALSDTTTKPELSLTDIVKALKPEQHATMKQGIMSESNSQSDVVRAYLNVLCGEEQVADGRAFLIREAVLTTLVRDRLGEKAARVLAVVARARKASETTVRDCAMLPLKQARLILAQLSRLSLVETQEVPKTSSKLRLTSAASEYHLWQVDLPRVYSVLLAGLYKTLGNISQRGETEVTKRGEAIERETKAGDERDRLHKKDQDDLSELDDVRRKLGLAELRSEMVVFVLRDLPGWPKQVR